MDETIWERLKIYTDSIQELLESLPSPERIRAMVEKVGGAVAPQQLGIDPLLVERSLKEAHRLRLNRFTMLYCLNECMLME